MRCEPKTPRRDVGADFYKLLDRNKELFIVATTEEADDELTTTGSRDISLRILTRLRTKEVKRFGGYTETDETFLRDCVRILEDGALPKPTTKKVWEAIKNEVDPLRILDILKRDIPAEFFHNTRATQAKQSANPREVILSAYLINEQA